MWGLLSHANFNNKQTYKVGVHIERVFSFKSQFWSLPILVYSKDNLGKVWKNFFNFSLTTSTADWYVWLCCSLLYCLDSSIFTFSYLFLILNPPFLLVQFQSRIFFFVKLSPKQEKSFDLMSKKLKQCNEIKYPLSNLSLIKFSYLLVGWLYFGSHVEFLSVRLFFLFSRACVFTCLVCVKVLLFPLYP